jgi:hypothetical protein
MRALASLVSAVLITVGISCKSIAGDEKSDPANGSGDPHTWAYTLSLSKNNFDLAQGATDTIIVTITRSGGFTGPVTVEAFLPPGPGGPTVVVENVTSTGVTTTTRLILSLPGSIPLIANFEVGIASNAANDNVPPQTTKLIFNVIRKNGVFVNVAPTLTVGQGQSGGLKVSVTRTNFTSPVPMSIALAPGVTGITATFDPNPITDTTTQMVISVASTVALGTYNVGVRALEGQGALQGTAPLALTVVQAGTFSISPNTSTLFVPRGTTVPVGITINRTNFTGPITFGVEGAPAGLGITIANPALGNNFSISFSNTGAAAAGSYPLTITAQSPGAANQSANLTVTLN